jgi:hypothetical protein
MGHAMRAQRAHKASRCRSLKMRWVTMAREVSTGPVAHVGRLPRGPKAIRKAHLRTGTAYAALLSWLLIIRWTLAARVFSAKGFVMTSMPFSIRAFLMAMLSA